MNIISLFLLFFVWNTWAEDLSQVVSGAETKDFLAPKEDEVRTSPFAYERSKEDKYSGKISNSAEENFVVGTNDSTDLSIKDYDKKKLKSSGYVVPGTFEKEENYLALDKKKFSNDLRGKATSAFNIAYFKDSFQYQSSNDVINRTIGQGYKHVKAGMIQIHSDHYIYKSFLMNFFWVAGGGVSYNSGRGSFVNSGTRSETTLTFWEVPADLGLGVEVLLYHWFTITGAAGPSGMILSQSRSDFQNGETGKNKFQFGQGQFACAKFKINLSSFNNGLAYDLFSNSQITNLSLNLEARYENYKKFQDSSLAISGQSYGLGFTFEFL
jgi:hypothetical protein